MPSAPLGLVDLQKMHGLPATDFKLDRKLPVTEQVYRALREEIVSMRFVPGTSISESALCREFGVSRTPVRAAIQLLVEESLIDVFPNQGSFVAPIRLDQLEDSHFVRLSVEVALLGDVVERWSPVAGEALRGSVRAQRQAIVDGNLDSCQREDERFHQLLAISAGRPGVWPTILGATTRLVRFMRLCGTPDRLPVALEEHEAVLDALQRRDLPGAHEALSFHISRNFHLVDGMRDRFPEFFGD